MLYFPACMALHALDKAELNERVTSIGTWSSVSSERNPSSSPNLFVIGRK